MELFEPRSTSLRGNHNGSSSSNPELFDIIHSNRGGSYYYNNSSNVNSNGEDIGIRQSTSDIIEDRHHHQQQLYYSHYYPPPSSTTMPSSEFPPHQQHCIKWGGGSAGFKGGSKESENGEMKPNINININNGNNNNNNNLSVIVPSFVRRQRPSSVPPRCRVEGCKADLSHSKGYHRRHKVCDNHSKAPLVVVNSVEQRFCQQCSRFHLVAEFDDAKRSCRRRLASHNERRRKSTQESMALMSTLDDRRSFDLVVDRNCNYQQLDSAINRAAAASSMNWMKFPLDMSMNMPAYNQGMKDPFSSYSPLHQLPCNSSTTTTSLSGGGGGGYGNSSAFDRLGNGAYTAFNAVKMDPFDQERAADIIMQQQRRRGGGPVVELASNNGGYGSSGAINMQGHNSNYCDEEVEVRKAEEAEEEEEEALTLFDSPFVHEEKSGQRRRPPCSNSVSEVAPGRALSLLSALQLPPPSSTNTDTTITTTSAVAAASSTGSCFDLVADNSRPSFSRGFNLNHSYTSISHHNRHQQFASLVMADPDAPFDSMSHTFDSLHHL